MWVLINRTDTYWWVLATSCLPTCSSMTVHPCCLHQATELPQRELLTNLYDSPLPHWVGSALLAPVPASAWPALWLQISGGPPWPQVEMFLLHQHLHWITVFLSSHLKLTKPPPLLGSLSFCLPAFHVSSLLSRHPLCGGWGAPDEAFHPLWKQGESAVLADGLGRKLNAVYSATILSALRLPGSRVLSGSPCKNKFVHQLIP